MKPPLEQKLRAWWSHKQALDGRLDGAAPADVLAETGWARSLGGVGPYLTLAARAGTSREAVDAAVASLGIYELPAARNCTYVVPAADFALALKAGAGFSTELKTVMKLGVTEKEIARLREAVVSALGKGPLEPDEIRESAGPAVRNLGEEGKKRGVTTTLPVALNQLQTEGEIRRVPMNGRLDQQRYRYALWRPNPLAQWKLSSAEVAVELARRYFAWTGPATIGEFQWFSALSLKAAKAAIEPLGLTPLTPLMPLAPPRRRSPDVSRRSRKAGIFPGPQAGAVQAGRQHRRHQPAAPRFEEHRRAGGYRAHGYARARLGRADGSAQPCDCRSR